MNKRSPISINSEAVLLCGQCTKLAFTYMKPRLEMAALNVTIIQKKRKTFHHVMSSNLDDFTTEDLKGKKENVL